MAVEKGETYDFVKRTKENFDFITKLMQNTKSQVFRDSNQLDFRDFTNLINNCLGLISYVYEYSIQKISEDITNEEKLKRVFSSSHTNIDKYGTITTCLSMDKQGRDEQTITTLLYHMRNAICHGHVEPILSEGNHGIITGAIFWDQFKNSENFRCSMTIEEITNFANEIVKTYKQYFNSKN